MRVCPTGRARLVASCLVLVMVSAPRLSLFVPLVVGAANDSHSGLAPTPHHLGPLHRKPPTAQGAVP